MISGNGGGAGFRGICIPLSNQQTVRRLLEYADASMSYQGMSYERLDGELHACIQLKPGLALYIPREVIEDTGSVKPVNVSIIKSGEGVLIDTGRRDNILCIRLTEFERSLVEQSAREAGYSNVAEYVRDRLFSRVLEYTPGMQP